MARTKQKLSPAEIVEALKHEPLIGASAASDLLGIHASNFRRDARPHLTAVEVEGIRPVYFRSEVESLAREWAGKLRKADGRRDAGLERRRAVPV